ncbi:hypothetical protein F5883DRAFT_177349 [Diaporthe sp. PMI_573]|nr:hypothetical protein F5883DRAFT_177349 [Diaporthaceae sp. PMI_573]
MPRKCLGFHRSGVRSFYWVTLQALNLTAQRDTKFNLAVVKDPNQVATLAARDSVTMRTTTVLRLLFFASTLVGLRRSARSANLFQLDPSQSWKLYLDVTLGLAAAVFAAWIWCVRPSNIRRQRGPRYVRYLGKIQEDNVVLRVVQAEKRRIVICGGMRIGMTNSFDAAGFLSRHWKR